MGGQACVLYGAAEFSRDLDLCLDPDPENLARLQSALSELQAETVAVPPFLGPFLEKGHAVHFRSQHEEVRGLCIDVMTRMRGVDDFSTLWSRRTTLGEDPETLELLSLPDLVRAKKTQRDKDWPMIRRLLEADYMSQRAQPNQAQVEFWLREMRTPALLVELAERFPEAALGVACVRPLLALARSGDEEALRKALSDEEERERATDREYWRPLREELQRLRRERHRTE